MAEGASVGGGPTYKGAGLRSWLAAFTQLHGQEAVRTTLALVEPELREAFEFQRITASGWYPLGWSRALHAAAQRATGKGPALARAIGKEAMRLDLSGVYRVFLIVVSPQAIIGKSARLFSSFYSHGSMSVVEARSGMTHVKWEGCHGFDQNIWQDLLGSCEASLELCGAKDLRIRYVEGGRDGDVDAQAQAFWR